MFQLRRPIINQGSRKHSVRHVSRWSFDRSTTRGGKGIRKRLARENREAARFWPVRFLSLTSRTAEQLDQLVAGRSARFTKNGSRVDRPYTRRQCRGRHQYIKRKSHASCANSSVAEPMRHRTGFHPHCIRPSRSSGVRRANA